MEFQYSGYAVPLFLATAITVALAWYALRRRQQAEARTFGLAMIALSWWSFFYALHITGANLETQYLFNRLKYIGVMAFPALWVVLALQYAHRHELLTRRNLILLFLPGAVSLLIVLSDPWTHLWWSEIWLGKFNGQPVLEHTYAWPYFAHALISYAYIAAGLWLYVRLYRTTSRVYRFQSALTIVAASIPLVASILTQVGLSPLPWGLDCFFFAVSSLIIAIAIFRYRFLDIVPIARKAIVEQIPEGVIVIDAKGRIADANPAAREILGAGQRSIVGRPLVESVSSPQLRQALATMIQGSGSWPRQQDIHLGDGVDSQALSLSATPLEQSTVGPLGQIIVLQDISERVAAQQALGDLYRQAEVERKRLSLIISTASDAIVMLDNQGAILASNPAARTLLKTESRAQFPPALQSVLDEAQASNRMVQAKIVIGQQSLHAVATPTADAGLVVTLHDVTHFEELAHLKDQFVATISHDLRSPLTSIYGFAQLAQLDKTSEEKRKLALQRIETTSRRMTTLVNNLLDLATLETGVGTRVEPVDLGQLAYTAVEDLEGSAVAKGLTLRCEVQPHPLVSAHPQLMTQVWRNLIDNAIKYTSAGSITVRVEATDKQVIGQVQDTGLGIAPADVRYVFDKFYRARQPDSSEIVGSGLGLSLVKTIVEKHGGQVWLESEVGVGSTVTFTLPLSTQER